MACLDGLYLSSAITKVPDGAWFTLTLAGVLACVFILWRFGKEQQWQAEASDRFQTTHLVGVNKNGQIQLTDRYGGYTLSNIKAFGIFFDKAGETTPAVFTQFLSKLIAAPEIMIFFHIRPLEVPSVLPEDRYTVSRLSIPNCYRLIVRHGFMDEVITPDLASLVHEQIHDFMIRQAATRKPSVPLPSPSLQARENTSIPPPPQTEEIDNAAITESCTSSSDKEKRPQDSDEKISATLAHLKQCHDRQVLYVIGKEQMKVKAGTGIWRTTLLKSFLWLRENTRTKIANLRVSTEKIIEVGFVKEI
ncbi:hypothetical protein GP486_002929 [Trichoglossum hirsutum]|uniref:Potassium transporter n=1 Tax=Trichoglossum hirsutum TaxID=265104 RepID=A0A9P8RRN5_9PEZI|nr:hypothetical protein GP486_002929 [Trichoglossum hirsutum]